MSLGRQEPVIISYRSVSPNGGVSRKRRGNWRRKEGERRTKVSGLGIIILSKAKSVAAQQRRRRRRRRRKRRRRTSQNTACQAIKWIQFGPGMLVGWLCVFFLRCKQARGGKLTEREEKKNLICKRIWEEKGGLIRTSGCLEGGGGGVY